MGTHPIFESDFDCLTDMNGLVSYDSSGSEDESEPTPKLAPPKPQTPTKSSPPPKNKSPVSSTSKNPQQSSVSSSGPLSGSILASEYQLRMLSKQRSKAARDGSKKRIFITAPNLEDLEEPEVTVKKKKITASTTRSKLFSALPKPSQSTNSMSSKLTISKTPRPSGPDPNGPLIPDRGEMEQNQSEP